MSTKRKSEARVARGPGGRPRKYSDDALVEAALRVLEREGYAALTVRALAQELGTSPATLYNYVESIEPIEAMALHRITKQLPRPSASTGPELRCELLDYLRAARRLLMQHPAVMFPPIGSAAERSLREIGIQWVQALLQFAEDEKRALMALSGLAAIVVAVVERDRMHGPDYEGRARAARDPASPPGLRFEEYLAEMIDILLPGMKDGKKGTKATKRRSLRNE